MPDWGRGVSADLHLHSKYSGGTSSRMEVDTISQQASLKGLGLVGTGDILHPGWRKEVRERLEEVEEGTLEHPRYRTRFLLTGEVEDSRRVHHLLLFPSFSAVEEVERLFSRRSEDLGREGRPHVDLSPPEVAEAALSAGCLVGPSHAFTPWTSLYKEFNSLRECYEDQADKISFLELGLSADTSMADRISELSGLTFLSNSDSHSPWPERLGREFNRFGIQEPTFEEVRKAVERREGRKVVLNVGFDPRLGKYHRTACSRCFKQFELEKARELGWKCDECGGWVKKGVWDRVNELADLPEPSSPPHRPPYLRVAPLAEILALGWGTEVRDPRVRETWRKLVERFGSEIEVLVDAPPEEMEKVVEKRVSDLIMAFRRQELRVFPGGGGRYGRLELPPHLSRRVGQRTLGDFT
ncbi:MAG: TIGR00375 family protein [Candidatus Hadarchaeales archaeon]